MPTRTACLCWLTWPCKESLPSLGHLEDTVGVNLEDGWCQAPHNLELLEDFRVGDSLCMFGKGLLVWRL